MINKLEFEGCFSIFTTNDDKNIAYHVTDDKSSVDIARKNLAQKYDFDIKNLKYMNQVHGNEVQITDEKTLYHCDGLISNNPDDILMVMVADCIPILFFDKVKKVIGVAHAGRNGTFLNISKSIIEKMVDRFDCRADDIKVILGPSIQKCCYEVSVELSDIVKKSFGKEFENKRYIDLQGINKKQLLELGIKEENIKVSSICTKCGSNKYFSYRLDKTCGRFAGIIKLTN
jgi:YfiH family protein